MQADSRVFEEVGKQLFAATKGVLSLSALRGIMKDHDGTGKLSSRVPDRRGTVFNGDLPAVAGD